MSASGRPRRGRAEKTRVGFHAVEIRKNSPILHLNTVVPAMPAPAHINNRPRPGVPTNFPPRTMTSPRTVTTSGAPTTSKPSYGL